MFVLELLTEYERAIWMQLGKFKNYLSLTLQRAFTKISLLVQRVVFVLTKKLWAHSLSSVLWSLVLENVFLA